MPSVIDALVEVCETCFQVIGLLRYLMADIRDMRGSLMEGTML